MTETCLPKKLAIRKNDQVQVMAGREKGKIGKVLKINTKTGRVTVEKINMVKKHTRPTQSTAGGIVEQELPLHYSNVLLFCGKCSRGVRHGNKVVEKSGTSHKVKLRVCKRCGESLAQA